MAVFIRGGSGGWVTGTYRPQASLWFNWGDFQEKSEFQKLFGWQKEIQYLFSGKRMIVKLYAEEPLNFC